MKENTSELKRQAPQLKKVTIHYMELEYVRLNDQTRIERVLLYELHDPKADPSETNTKFRVSYKPVEYETQPLETDDSTGLKLRKKPIRKPRLLKDMNSIFIEIQKALDKKGEIVLQIEVTPLHNVTKDSKGNTVDEKTYYIMDYTQVEAIDILKE